MSYTLVRLYNFIFTRFLQRSELSTKSRLINLDKWDLVGSHVDGAVNFEIYL